MQVIGFNLEKISAERKKPVAGKLEIKSNINVKEIATEKLSVIKDKDVLKFSFEFSINYEPGIADLKFEGSVLVITEKNQAKDILKKWKTKKIADEYRIPLFNLILTKCNLRALQFEEELALPTHIPMPKIQPPQNDKGYVQ